MPKVEPQARDASWMLLERLLPRFLFDAGHSKPLYVLKAWLLALLPSFALALLVSLIADNPPAPDFGGTGPVVFAMLVLMAPVVETFLMTPPLLLFNRFLGAGPAVLLSAILWGALHSSQVALWGLIIWWPFLIFSIVLLVWRKQSLATAMLMVIAVHAMQNAVPGLALLFG